MLFGVLMVFQKVHKFLASRPKYPLNINPNSSTKLVFSSKEMFEHDHDH